MFVEWPFICTAVCVYQRIRSEKLTFTIELLKDESSEIDLVGPTLPALKAMLEFPVSAVDTQEKNTYRRLVHGLLSACLLNVDAMRLVGLSSVIAQILNSLIYYLAVARA